MHSDLKKAENFSVRLGEVRFRGWELNPRSIPSGVDTHSIRADDLRPSMQQKGVDMRIGLDIASLTLKQQVDIIVLVTGDADFIPPMKFARREGVQLALVALNHDIHKDLYEHADISLDINTDDCKKDGTKEKIYKNKKLPKRNSLKNRKLRFK